jgi:branched-subunit amino acid ABC-type transport system permease component
MFAGTIIGVVISFTATALIGAGFSNAVIFILMATTPPTKPMGFFGDKL